MVSFAGLDIEVNSIVDFLKKELRLHTVCRQLICKQIIQEKAHELGVTVSDDEIQAKADELRRELRLESAQKTMTWLQERLITADEWEDSIREHLISEKLVVEMFRETANYRFQQQQLDFEKILLYKIETANSKLAQELAYQIEEEEISFFEAAHRYDRTLDRRRTCGYEGEVSRWALDPDVAASLFAAPAHTVIGPVAEDHVSVLFYVDEFVEPALTPQTHRAICDRLFAEWLDAELQRRMPA